MNITLPDDLLPAANMSEADLMREIALMLFQQERITLGRASILCGMNQIEFQQLLSSRGICIHYDIADYETDLQSLKARGWL